MRGCTGPGSVGSSGSTSREERSEVSEQERGSYHFGNRPDKFYDLAKDPSNGITSPPPLAARSCSGDAASCLSGTPKPLLPTIDRAIHKRRISA